MHTRTHKFDPLTTRKDIHCTYLRDGKGKLVSFTAIDASEVEGEVDGERLLSKRTLVCILTVQRVAIHTQRACDIARVS